MRLTWVDATKGLAIALVICDHVFQSLWDAGLADGCMSATDIIILVRTLVLPVFFVISGLLAGRRLASRTSFYTKWLVAIVWPYLLWGAVVVVLEQLLRGVRSPVDTSPTNLSLPYTPIAWLWFLYVLAIFQLLARAMHRWPWTLVALGLAGVIVDALWSLPVLPHLCCYFLIFYAAGMAANPRMLVRRIPSALGLGALVVSVPLTLIAIPDLPHVSTWPGISASIAGTITLCWLGQRLEKARVLVYLGRRSMAIYVVHCFFLSATRVALAKGLGITNLPILICASLVAGFLGALATYEIAARLRITVIAGLGFPAYAPRRNAAALARDPR